jgi:uncharacterized protein YqeY
MSATLARGRANVEGVSEAEIERMLQTMIKQRREAITLYDQGNHLRRIARKLH